MLRQKEKQAGGPNWGSHLQLLPLLLAESFYLKQIVSWKQHFKWLAISKFSYQNTDLVFKHIKQQTPKSLLLTISISVARASPSVSL